MERGIPNTIPKWLPYLIGFIIINNILGFIIDDLLLTILIPLLILKLVRHRQHKPHSQYSHHNEKEEYIDVEYEILD